MTKLFWPLILLVLVSSFSMPLSSSSAEAPVGRIWIKAGEMVTVRRAPNGQWLQVSRYPVTSRKPSRYDRLYFGPWVKDGPRPALGPRNADETADYFPPDPDTIRFSLARTSNRAAWVLLVENGFSGWFRYTAALPLREGEKPTPVCTVSPRSPGVELWPYPGDTFMVVVGDYALIEPPADGQHVCQ
jgi:hypothetical protein